MFVCQDPSSVYKLDPIDYGRRVALEREIQKAMVVGELSSNVCFDESSNFIITASMMGVKSMQL